MSAPMSIAFVTHDGKFVQSLVGVYVVQQYDGGVGVRVYSSIAGSLTYQIERNVSALGLALTVQEIVNALKNGITYISTSQREAWSEFDTLPIPQT